jgi:RecQ family ATP-dependent DNA helicase
MTSLFCGAAEGGAEPALRMLKGRRRAAPILAVETGDEERLLQTLSSFFGFSSFRDKQKDVCLNIMKPGSQTVALFPTGMGKSLCFQCPAVALGGVSLIVSPLISLMQDQVAALQKLCAATNGRVRCDFYAANAPDAEKKRIKALLNNARAEIVDQRKSYLVYVTPEFLDRNMNLVKKLAQQEALTLVAIDEAHCVIEYGTDFRPDYLKLGQLADLGRSSMRVVALTASVSHQTLGEMLKSLRMEGAVQFRSSFNRVNISYEVHYTDTLAEQGKDALDRQRFDLVEWIENSPERRGQSGIVYVRKKTDCEEVAKRLSSAGVRAEAYHAAVKDKSDVQQRWMRGETQVVVATTAFGMGIDKADVRFVVNWSIPSSMADFYQMSGRGGRDGKQSFSLAYMGSDDMKVVKYLSSLPEAEKPGQDMDATQQEKKTAAKMAHLQVVLDYLSTPKCRRAMILAYFGETLPPGANCRSCDYCTNPKLVQKLIDRSGAFEVERFNQRIGGGGPAKPDGSIFAREENPDSIANSSNTGSSFKNSRQVMQERAEERISKKLKVDSVIPTATARAVVGQPTRVHSVDFLEKAIRENLGHFKESDEEAGTWAVREEQRIFKACKESQAAYKGRVIALASSTRNLTKKYEFVK